MLAAPIFSTSTTEVLRGAVGNLAEDAPAVRQPASTGVACDLDEVSWRDERCCGSLNRPGARQVRGRALSLRPGIAASTGGAGEARPETEPFAPAEVIRAKLTDATEEAALRAAGPLYPMPHGLPQ